MQSMSRTKFTMMSLFALALFAALMALGNWQIKRLAWKEDLLQTIQSRIHQKPRPLETYFKTAPGTDYWPVTVSGTYRHTSERHFFATFEGRSGYFVYTPLEIVPQAFLSLAERQTVKNNAAKQSDSFLSLAERQTVKNNAAKQSDSFLSLAERQTVKNNAAKQSDSFVFVNRGFVSFDMKDAAKRPEGQTQGVITITGLARSILTEKPSASVPDNDIAKNIFYWKDFAAMRASAGLPNSAAVMDVFIDAGKSATPPTGIPTGGVTFIDLPNDHLQYAVTWYGLAGTLFGIWSAMAWRQRR
jgi:surfeit locus 1 family protein